jgi:hypothetical protein
MPDRNTQTGHGIQTHSPGQTSTGQRDEHETKPRFHRTRPETHQNLIHPDKEQQTKNNRRFMTIDVAGRFSLKNTPPRSRDLSARYSFASSRRRTRTGTTIAARSNHMLPPGDNSLMSASRPSPLTRIGNYGDNRIRTGDPLLAKQVLYQLSYVPLNKSSGRQQLWWAREDLNLRPHAYQACALTN